MTKAMDNGAAIRRFLLASTLAYLVAAVLSPDRGNMFSGLKTILLSPSQLTTDYFLIGGIAGTFLSVGLVGAVCTALAYIPGAPAVGGTVAAYFLTTGFSFWGINVLNMLPFVLGVFVHSLVKGEPFSKYTNSAMFATALCPLASELLLRYPNEAEVHGITAGGIVLTLIVCGGVGFLTPAMIAHSPSVHKGYDLYSAALPGGLLGFFLAAMLYKTAGYTVPEIAAHLDGSHPAVVWTFCAVFFALCILAGFRLNGNSFSGYGALLKDSGHKSDFVGKYGSGLSIMNVGVYGLMITAYYIAVNAMMGDVFGGFNGVTLGIIFCMVCFGAAGAHPGNVWPIMVGYVAASFIATRVVGGPFAVNAQAIMVGLCFASGLAPCAGVYGWWAGVIGGAMHYALVTSVPAIHGGFSLYNGGFTALVVAVILAPQLETFCKPKAERMGNKSNR